MTLLERERALEALQGALGEVAHGEGHVALVYGEAGIGKTSLVDCFARARGQPGRTLWEPAIPSTPRGRWGPSTTSPSRRTPPCSRGHHGAVMPFQGGQQPGQDGDEPLAGQTVAAIPRATGS
jgi:hypothetical protein